MLSSEKVVNFLSQNNKLRGEHRRTIAKLIHTDVFRKTQKNVSTLPNAAKRVRAFGRMYRLNISILAFVGIMFRRRDRTPTRMPFYMQCSQAP